MGFGRKLAAAFAALACAMTLVACGGAPAETTPAETPAEEQGPDLEALRDEFVGSWEMTSMEGENYEVTPEDYAEFSELGMHVTMDLDEDGNLLVDVFGDQIEGEWEIKDETTITITIGSDTGDMPFEDGQLGLTYEGDTIFFEKVSDTPNMDRDPSENSGDGLMDDLADTDDSGSSSDYPDRFTDESVESQDNYVNNTVTLTASMDATIADDDTARIVLLGVGEDYEDTGYLFEIENRTDVDLYIQNVYTELDGEDVWDDSTLARVVPAGETCYGFFWFDADAGLSVDEDSTLSAAFGLYDIDQEEYGVYWLEL